MFHGNFRMNLKSFFQRFSYYSHISRQLSVTSWLLTEKFRCFCKICDSLFIQIITVSCKLATRAQSCCRKLRLDAVTESLPTCCLRNIPKAEVSFTKFANSKKTARSCGVRLILSSIKLLEEFCDRSSVMDEQHLP